jgi:3-hydroxyacyl-CoA dehydrogenase/enoyl-CoA hydratase/3-hydroxybutyryl-CoA epimerase
VYLYAQGKRTTPDRAVYAAVGGGAPRPADPKTVVERMLLAMVNEAARILDERIVMTAGELDLAMIMGTGFPPFRGGLLRYADALGLPYIVDRLDQLAKNVGSRFAVSEPLRRLAANGATFYGEYARK